MLKKILIVPICSFIFQSAKTQSSRVIFDSDMGPDYDDVGAITLLHKFDDEGKTKILATIASTKYVNVAAVFSVFNTYFKKSFIPVGVPKTTALEFRDWQHWSDSITSLYPHAIKKNDDAVDAVQLYRKILAAQPDNSVTIVTVGFLTNLNYLLKSAADSISSLNGLQLIKKKVKQLVCMAGRFPSGSEFNINQDFVSSKYVFENWPTPVLFSGFEIGVKINCGIPLIHNEKIQHSPVKDVFRISIPLAAEDSAGRKSWDETAVLVAVLGYNKWFTVKTGRILINPNDGSNSWMDDANGTQAYLVEKTSPAVLQKLINKFIQYQPQKL